MKRMIRGEAQNQSGSGEVGLTGSLIGNKRFISLLLRRRPELMSRRTILVAGRRNRPSRGFA